MADEDLAAVAEQQALEQRLSTLFAGWIDAVGERFRTGFGLAKAEVRLAISAFLMMIFLAVLAAGALLFAWGFLAFAVLQLLASSGFPIVTVAFALVAAHLLLAWSLWRVANRLIRHMEFPETRRLLETATAAEDSNHDDE